MGPLHLSSCPLGVIFPPPAAFQGKQLHRATTAGTASSPQLLQTLPWAQASCWLCHCGSPSAAVPAGRASPPCQSGLLSIRESPNSPWLQGHGMHGNGGGRMVLPCWAGTETPPRAAWTSGCYTASRESSLCSFHHSTCILFLESRHASRQLGQGPVERCRLLGSLKSRS